MTASKRWRVQFGPSLLLPGAMRYGRVENKAAGLTTVAAQRLRELQSFWRAQYGEPTATTKGALTIWEFAPVAGRKFRLTSPNEWGQGAGNGEWTDGKECER